MNGVLSVLDYCGITEYPNFVYKAFKTFELV